MTTLQTWEELRALIGGDIDSAKGSMSEASRKLEEFDTGEDEDSTMFIGIVQLRLTRAMQELAALS